MSKVLEQASQGASRVAVVFDEQNPQDATGSARLPLWCARAFCLLHENCEPRLESAAAGAPGAVRHDGAIVQIHQVLGNGETKSQPTKLAGHFGSALLERLEQCFEFGRINADAVVADFELELIAHCVPRHGVYFV